MQIVEKICADLDIELTPINVSRGPMRLRCPNVLAGMIEKYGEGHVILVLRTIAESRGNESALNSQIITAVSDIIRARPEWAAQGLRWIEAFDDVDLLAIATAGKPWRNFLPVKHYVAAHVVAQLRQSLG